MKQADLFEDDGVYCCRRIGRSYLLCGKKKSRFPFQLFVGPDWPCMLSTYGLIIGCTTLFINNIGTIWGYPVIIVTVFLLFLTLSFYSATACSDPGIVFVNRSRRSTINMNDIEQGRVSSVNKMIVGATNNLQIGAIGTDDEDEEEFECSNHKKNGVESDEECITQEDDSLQLDNLFAKRKYKVDKDIRNAVGGVVVDDNGASSTSLTMIDNLPIELGRSVNDNHINEDGLYHTSGSTTTTNGNVARIPSTDRNNSGDSSGGIGIGNIGNNRGAIRSLPPLSATIECGMCHIDRPRNAAHCHDCGLCVVKLDHHCPWTGKCIGEKTMQSFFAFLWSLTALICFVIIMVIVTAAKGDALFNFKHGNNS